MTNPLDPRPYDSIWEADGRRQDAMRKANDRYPDHSAGNLAKGHPLAFWALFVGGGAIGSAVALVWVLCS